MKKDTNTAAGPGNKKNIEDVNKQMVEKKIVNEQDQEKISNGENTTEIKTQEDEPMDVEQHIEDLDQSDDITEDDHKEKAGVF